MGDKINLYLASEYEYRRGLAHKLLEENVIDFCLVDHLPWTNAPEADDRIVTVNHVPSGNEEYSLVCDINELPTVSKELMEKMLPYESMALHIGMRRFNYPTTEYDEEKRKYLQHLRYWNYMFDKYKINLIVTHCIPHSQGMYVVYGLAQVKKIPMLIWHQTGGLFNNRCVWGYSLESLGKSIGERYIALSQNQENEDFELDDDIKDAYNSVKPEFDKGERTKYDLKMRKRNNDIYLKGYKFKKKLYINSYLRAVAKSIIRTGGIQQYRNNATWFRLTRRHLFAVKYFVRHLSCTISEYDRMAENADYSQKYILYLPQVYPEASVIPAAGVFGEQYNSIQMLARAAEKKGAFVYVKEHPQLPYRPWNFYSEIASIKNVKLIKSTEYSYDLMQNCLAVATQTGTCILEAIIMHKPVLVFGSGYFWKKAPGLFEITAESQGADVIEMLLNGYDISDADVKRYFYAIQLETLKEVDGEETYKRILDDSYVPEPFPLDDRINLIKSMIEEYCT